LVGTRNRELDGNVQNGVGTGDGPHWSSLPDDCIRPKHPTPTLAPYRGRP
jgi:hypothetical protein